jgi:hypothetical protein
LYCNGLFCGRSERLADDLIKLGYQNVRRYQLGAPAGVRLAVLCRWRSRHCCGCSCKMRPPY